MLDLKTNEQLVDDGWTHMEDYDWMEEAECELAWYKIADTHREYTLGEAFFNGAAGLYWRQGKASPQRLLPFISPAQSPTIPGLHTVKLKDFMCDTVA